MSGFCIGGDFQLFLKNTILIIITGSCIVKIAVFMPIRAGGFLSMIFFVKMFIEIILSSYFLRLLL